MHSRSEPKAAREREQRNHRRQHAETPAAPPLPQPTQLTPAELNHLVAPTAGTTVSIYLPTHRGGPDARQDHIRLKNLLADARRQAPSLEGALRKIEAMSATTAFWAHPAEGLALFCDQAEVRHYWLPEAMPALAIAAPRRHLKPLLPLLAGDGAFHVLELHQHGVRLHAGTRFGLKELAIPGIPAKVEDLVQSGGDKRDVEVRTLHATGGGSTVWFGGGHDEGAKDLLRRYFRAVDDGVRAVLNGGGSPLVLAGVDWLIPLYREASRYGHVVHDGIAKDTAELDDRELHRRAWRLVAARFDRAERQAEERHAALVGTARRAEILSDVLATAVAGRVESLLIAVDRDCWGTDADGGALVQHDVRQPGDEDLLNVAAVLALRTGAAVWAVPSARIPGGDAASAALRY